MIIDADGHVFEPMDLWERYLAPKYRDEAPLRVPGPSGHSIFVVEGEVRPRTGPCTTIPWSSWDNIMPGITRMDPQTRNADVFEGSGLSAVSQIAAMDVEGIDLGLLYPSFGMFIWGRRRPDLAVAYAQAYNTWMSEFVSDNRDRLCGVGVLPAQDPEGSCDEARRCVEDLGFPALCMHPNPVDDVRFDDPSYDRLFGVIEDLGVPITFHEATGERFSTSGANRFDNFFFTHCISHPFEQMLACTAIVGGGVLARHPRLRVSFLESGCSWLPFWLPRLDEHYEKRASEVPWLERRPSEYFAEQCWISCDPDELGVRYAVDYMPDRVLFASDFPHWDGAFPKAVKEFAERDDLTEDSKRAVLGENILAMFRDVPNFPAAKLGADAPTPA